MSHTNFDKMKYTISVLLLCSFVATFAQNNFFINFKKPSHERAFSCVQTSNGEFIIAGEKSETGYNGIHTGYLAMLSKSGEIVHENEFIDTNNSRLCIILPYKTNSEDFLCIGAADSTSEMKTFGCKTFFTIDAELSVLRQKKYAFTENYTLYPWQYLIKDDSILFLMTDYSINEFNGSQPRLLDVVKYILPFDSIANYSDTILSVSQDLNFNVLTNQLNVYIFPSHRKLILNEDLEFVAEAKYHSNFPTNICITPLNDTNYLLTGTAYNTSSINMQAGVIKYSYYGNPLDSLYYSPNTDTNFYAGGRQNTTINGDNIFIAGFYNVNAWLFPYNYNPSWVTISKLDLDLNMISTHFYGGDAQYCPYSIIATSDGGCFVTGYSYDYINNLPNNNYELDIFALKTDSDGLITELPDQPQAKAHDAIVYPNPGIEYLNIQSGPQITGAEFYMFDINGSAVIVEKITNTQLKVNTAYLPSGTYPWQIVFKNKVIESGKWVKK